MVKFVCWKSFEGSAGLGRVGYPVFAPDRYGVEIRESCGS